jgi:hypothetical protein
MALIQLTVLWAQCPAAVGGTMSRRMRGDDLSPHVGGMIYHRIGGTIYHRLTAIFHIAYRLPTSR